MRIIFVADEMEEEMDKEEIENEIMNTNDDAVKDELGKEVVELDEEEEETKEDLDAVIEEDEDLADEYQGRLNVYRERAQVQFPSLTLFSFPCRFCRRNVR